MTHARLHRALLRGVRFDAEERVFIVQIGRFRGQIEVEDVPFWVVAYDAKTGEVQLTDTSTEPIQPATLSADPDGVFRVQVKDRFPARFSHAGQAHLLEHLEVRDETLSLQVGDAWIPVPGLEREL